MYSPQSSFRLASAVICLLVCLCLSQVSAAGSTYCADFNTASTNQNTSIYQSNGLCTDFCKSDYAFAVLRDDACWCSNYAPGSTTDGCTQKCPGYPSDICGGNGLYYYLALSIAPSGTEGGSSAAASSTQQPSTATVVSSAEPVTVTATPEAVTVFTSSSAPSSTTSSSSSTPEPSTSAAASTQQPATSFTPTFATTSTTAAPPSSSTPTSSLTWTPTPVTSLETVTGQVRTVTVTPTAPPNSQSQNPVSKSSGDSGLSTGGAVGLTIGLVALVALISAIIYFCLKKRRKERAAEAAEAYNNSSRRGSSAGLGGQAPSRTMSEHSRYVLNTNGRDVVEAWEPDQDPPGSRQSQMISVDQRLNPFATVYQRGENKSRESVNTIRDDQDYSRRVQAQPPILRAINPDP
ncbi:hypothetical protein LSUE1_G007280 [Lachnellula suecica]|uniref:WSC domain-containing protein n=1 Tax=Lachnellula suecica TaxID=602035 RepID=A0A8T9BWD7_9HELO|nr:hypothetical protein LSUE1_G007280 [Lachnellula suecica]